MKCQNTLLYGWKSRFYRRSKPKILISSIDIKQINPVVYQAWIIQREEMCDGELRGNIKLESLPYFGGSDDYIAVSIKCSKCGYEFAGVNGLPNDVDSLNNFLTKLIKEIE